MANAGEYRLHRPAISPTGSGLMAGSAVLLAVSLLFPWFEGRVATGFVQYYGFELGFAVFCVIVLVTTVGLGLWSSWVRRAFFVVVLSLSASIITALFAGLALALSSTITRLVSIVGLSDIVGIRIRSGLTVLLVGALLGIAGSTMVIWRWAVSAVSSSVEMPSWKRGFSPTVHTGARSLLEDDDQFESAHSGMPSSSTYDEDEW